MISSQESDEVQIVSVSKRQRCNVISDSESDVIDLTGSGMTNLSANSR